MTSTNTSIKNLLLSLNDKPTVIYSAYLRITKDYATAAALAQVLYWHKKMGRKFYKTDADFSTELALTPKQFVRVKDKLKSYDFLKITREQIPAKTFYHVDYEKLASALIGKDTLPISATTPEESSFPLLVESSFYQKRETRCSQKVESNTENKQKLLQNNNTAPPKIQPKPDLDLSPVVVVELEKTFSNTDLSASKKALATIPAPYHLQVLAVLMLQLTKQAIPNKVGYLCRLVSSVKNGTFTPIPATAVPISLDERLKQEKINKAKQEERGKIDNVSYFVGQVKRFGDKFLVPEQYQQAVFERLAV